MRWGLNFRGDLRSLSVSELDEQLERAIEERQRVYAAISQLSTNKWLYQQGVGMPFGRGPVHSRAIYRITGWLYGASLTSPSLADLYILDCEIKDILDEGKARLRRREKEG